jgi:hypothetical protein
MRAAEIQNARPRAAVTIALTPRLYALTSSGFDISARARASIARRSAESRASALTGDADGHRGVGARVANECRKTGWVPRRSCSRYPPRALTEHFPAVVRYAYPRFNGRSACVCFALGNPRRSELIRAVGALGEEAS